MRQNNNRKGITSCKKNCEPSPPKLLRNYAQGFHRSYIGRLPLCCTAWTQTEVRTQAAMRLSSASKLIRSDRVQVVLLVS